MAEFRVGGLLFTSKFDSGNLARVEKVTREDEAGVVTTEPKPDYEFNVWTTPDCAGTEYENGNRSWFYFGIRGWAPTRLLKINIMNMNRQGKLYSQGHTPFTRTVPGKPRWDRIRDRPTFETVDGQFILTFNYRLLDVKGAITYFAFCFPWSYQESTEQFNALDIKFAHCKNLTPKSPLDGIYYHREHLINSMDNLRIELITITSCHGMLNEEEPRFDKNLFVDEDNPRPKKFRNKRVYMLTSRVHPGETPASYVFNGFLDFILRENDPRAKMLRKYYIFKMIPILNPDGVCRGHYRTDQLGVNLNRLYLNPDPKLHPGIYASKSVLVYHHVKNRVVREEDKVNFKIQFPGNFALTSESDCPKASSAASCQTQTQSQTMNNGNVNNSNSTSQGNNGASTSRSQHSDILGASISVSSKKSVQNSSSVMTKENSWVLDGRNKHDGGLYPSKAKVEKLNLADLDDPDSSLSDQDKSVQDENPIISSSCSSVLSNTLMNNKMDRITVDSDLRLRLSGLNMSDDCRGNLTQASMISIGLNDNSDDDLDPDTEHLGNEGSEDEGRGNTGTTGVSAHLNSPCLHDIPCQDSGIAFYVDLHGHASKRGCFIYGNYFENEDTQVENMLFPKLISMNSAHFDFTGCVFTERNMYTKDKRDGLSKEGSGRVAIYKALGITHSYTLECNYNTGRMVNPVPPCYGDDGRATPPPMAGFPPKYTQAHYEEVGKALCIAALDFYDINPWSRITLSELNSIHGVRDNVKRYLRSLRGGPRLPRNPVSRVYPKNNLPNNQNNNRLNRSNSINNDTIANPRAPVSRNNSINNDTNPGPNQPSRYVRRDSHPSMNQKRESLSQNQQRGQLGPIREGRTNFTPQPRKRTVNLPANYVPPGHRSSSVQQNTQPVSSSSAPVTLTMTTAPESKLTRQLSSADSITRNAEEEKLQQLKNVSLLAISKKSGPPSRIPLPTSSGNVKLTTSEGQELCAPRAPSGSGSRYNNQRSGQQTYPLKKASAELLPADAPLHFSEGLSHRSGSGIGSAGNMRSQYSNNHFPARHNASSVLVNSARGFGAGMTPSLLTQPHQQSSGFDLSSYVDSGGVPNGRVPSAEEHEGIPNLPDKPDTSDSPKKRRRYTFLKRRNPSPKLGSAGSKGQGKLSSATDSEAEKARPNRRRRRKSNRKVTQSPSSDEAIGGGQVDYLSSAGLGSSVEGTMLKPSPSRVSTSLPANSDKEISLRDHSGNRRRFRSPYEDLGMQVKVDFKRSSYPSGSTRHHQAPSKLTVFWVD